MPQGLTKGRAGAEHPYDFSFSGVKTAVARWVERRQQAGLDIPVDDICASLADSVATVLSRKAMAACHRFDTDTLIVGGGFSANSQLRCQASGVRRPGGRQGPYSEDQPVHGQWCHGGHAGRQSGQAGLSPSAPDFSIDSAMPMDRILM